LAHPPVALWELERSKKIVAAELKRIGTETEVFAHLTASRALEASALKTTRKTRRDQARRPKPEPTKPQPKPALDYSKPSRVETDEYGVPREAQ
jgi:hypothetical protein